MDDTTNNRELLLVVVGGVRGAGEAGALVVLGLLELAGEARGRRTREVVLDC